MSLRVIPELHSECSHQAYDLNLFSTQTGICQAPLPYDEVRIYSKSLFFVVGENLVGPVIRSIINVASRAFETWSSLCSRIPLFSMASATTVNCDPQFAAGVSYNIDATGGGIAVGDFNEDSLPDIASESSTGFNIIYNNGNGTFGAPFIYSLDGNPGTTSNILAKDLNGDNLTDIVLTADDSKILIYFGKGNKQFSAPISYSVQNSPFAMATGYIKKGPLPDLVVANQGSNTISILVNNGTGQFESQQIYAVGNGPDGVVVGDWNNDGNEDVATVNYNSQNMTVLFNQGDGSLIINATYPVGTYAARVAAIDVEGTEYPDLVVTRNPYVVLLYKNRGNGLFDTPMSISVGNGADGIAVGDLNNDGLPDMVITNYYANTISLLVNKGNGTFSPQIVYPTENSPLSVTLADFTGDGLPDIAVANKGNGTIIIYPNTVPSDCLYTTTSSSRATLTTTSIGNTAPSLMPASINPSTSQMDQTTTTVLKYSASHSTPLTSTVTNHIPPSTTFVSASSSDRSIDVSSSTITTASGKRETSLPTLPSTSIYNILPLTFSSTSSMGRSIDTANPTPTTESVNIEISNTLLPSATPSNSPIFLTTTRGPQAGTSISIAATSTFHTTEYLSPTTDQNSTQPAGSVSSLDTSGNKTAIIGGVVGTTALLGVTAALVVVIYKRSHSSHGYRAKNPPKGPIQDMMELSVSSQIIFHNNPLDGPELGGVAVGSQEHIPTHTSELYESINGETDGTVIVPVEQYVPMSLYSNQPTSTHQYEPVPDRSKIDYVEPVRKEEE